jgi:hypothetical protein
MKLRTTLLLPTGLVIYAGESMMFDSNGMALKHDYAIDKRCISGIIETVRDIKVETEEGRLLLAAIACITTSSDYSNKTPDEILAMLYDTSKTMFANESDDAQLVAEPTPIYDPPAMLKNLSAIKTAERVVRDMFMQSYDDVIQQMGEDNALDDTIDKVVEIINEKLSSNTDMSECTQVYVQNYVLYFVTVHGTFPIPIDIKDNKIAKLC